MQILTLSSSDSISCNALRTMSVIMVSKASMHIVSASVVPLYVPPADIAVLTFSYFLKLPDTSHLRRFFCILLMALSDLDPTPDLHESSSASVSASVSFPRDAVF